MSTSETNFVSCTSAHALFSQHLPKPRGPELQPILVTPRRLSGTLLNKATELVDLPLGPCWPGGPTEPGPPGAPVLPGNPALPDEPVHPVLPTGPGNPVSPTLPVAPWGPRGPNGPTVTNDSQSTVYRNI